MSPWPLRQSAVVFALVLAALPLVASSLEVPPWHGGRSCVRWRPKGT
jgi:hypothetical protein